MCFYVQGSSPLHLCCQEGHLDLLMWLLDHDADLNLRDNFGWKPFHSACVAGQSHVVKFLTQINCSNVLNKKRYFTHSENFSIVKIFE